MSQPKTKQGRPNKYKIGSEFYSTKIPIGMKAEADLAIEKKFAKYQTDQYKKFKAKKSEADVNTNPETK